MHGSVTERETHEPFGVESSVTTARMKLEEDWLFSFTALFTPAACRAEPELRAPGPGARRGAGLQRARRGAAMSSCAACQAPFTKDRRGLKCTLCEERRVAEPAYYCNRSCQKQHWSAHKAYHAQLAAEVARNHDAADPRRVEGAGQRADDLAALGKRVASSDPLLSLLAQADQARLRRDFKLAVKLGKRAVAMQPDDPHTDERLRSRVEGVAHQKLAHSYTDSGDFTSAVPHLLRAWTYPADEDEMVAQSASLLYLCLVQPSCAAHKPAWFTDRSQAGLQTLKNMADRAVAALPTETMALQMRSSVYQMLPESLVTAVELRQVLRGDRDVLKTLKEGSAAHAHQSGVAQLAEARLRLRIAADVAVMKTASPEKIAQAVAEAKEREAARATPPGATPPELGGMTKGQSEKFMKLARAGDVEQLTQLLELGSIDLQPGIDYFKVASRVWTAGVQDREL